MAEYLPYAFPGDVVTFTAGEALTAGTLVEVGAADMAVVGAQTDSAKVVGVCARDAASGAEVPVYVRGQIHRLTAVGAVTRGDLVVADHSVADGRVKTAAAVALADIEGGAAAVAPVNRNARSLVGLALESIADTASGRVMFVN